MSEVDYDGANYSPPPPSPSPASRAQLALSQPTSTPRGSGSSGLFATPASTTGRSASSQPPLFLPSPRNILKRPAQDSSQFAQRISTKMRLTGSQTQEVIETSKLTTAEQLVWIVAHIVKTEAGQAKQIQLIADAKYTIPDGIKDFIEKYTAIIIIDGSLAGYQDVPFNIFTECFIARGSNWAQIRSTDSQWSVIAQRTRSRISDRRHSLKLLLTASIGTVNPENPETNIGCKTIKKLTLEACEWSRTRKFTPSIELAARLAFLRRLLRKYTGDTKKFWSHVDQELVRIREKNNNNGEAIARVFKAFLLIDFARFGDCEDEVHKFVAILDMDEQVGEPAADAE